MDAKEQIMGFLSTNGPSLPYAVSKLIGSDTFLSAAYLSELKAHGKIKISSLKVGGGSPLYFIKGQEEQLQKFAHNLNEKEKKIYDILKSKKIIKDVSLVPVFRAAIRTIQDFAYPFNIEVEGKK